MSKALKISLIVLLIAVIVYVLYRLFGKKQVQAQENNTITAPAYATEAGKDDSFPLQLGSRGPNVEYLQRALNTIRPENKLTIDGVLGNNTRQALLVTVSTNLSFLPLTKDRFNKILVLANDKR